MFKSYLENKILKKKQIMVLDIFKFDNIIDKSIHSNIKTNNSKLELLRENLP